MEDKMSVQMLIRISPEMKDSLARIARSEGKSTSHVIREIIETYIQDRDIGIYIDDLWGRIGDKLKSKGFRQKDIPEMVRHVRESNK
jgi:predicted DNA-binding protein